MKKVPVLLIALVCLFLHTGLAQVPDSHLTVRLHRDVFSDSFKLVFKEQGSAAVDDHDALKVSEGYLSVSSLHDKGIKLAIEEKNYAENNMETALFVKGYTSGLYSLSLTTTDFKAAGREVILFDKFLNKETVLQSNATTDYAFTIDSNALESQGNNRFSVLLNKVSFPVLNRDGGLIAYPNPFKDTLSLHVGDHVTGPGEVWLKDLLGRVVWRKQFGNVQSNTVLVLAGMDLIPGLYLLEWRDQNELKKFKTLKVIKQ
jgi:hypothetical protein